MDKIFIEQAKNIRREYIKNSKEISKCEDQIEKYKEVLTEVQGELNEEMNQDEILQKLNLVEKNIKEIEKIIEPYILKIKKLENDADKLFDNIREKYPKMTTEDVRNELIPHLIEINF